MSDGQPSNSPALAYANWLIKLAYQTGLPILGLYRRPVLINHNIRAHDFAKPIRLRYAAEE